MCRVFRLLLRPPPLIKSPDDSGRRSGSVGSGTPDKAHQGYGKQHVGTSSRVCPPQSDYPFSVAGGDVMRLSLHASEVILARYGQRKLSIVSQPLLQGCLCVCFVYLGCEQNHTCSYILYECAPSCFRCYGPNYTSSRARLNTMFRVSCFSSPAPPTSTYKITR